MYLGIAGILFIATTLQASIGFGSNLIAMPTVALFAPEFVPGPLLFSSMLVAFFMIFRERTAVDVKPVRTAIFGRVLGTAFGVLAIGAMSARSFGFLIGGGVLVMVGFVMSGAPIERTTRNMWLAGTISGFGASTAGIGGPPIALMYQSSEGPEIRSSMAAFFIFGSIITLIGLNIAGKFGGEEILSGIALSPAAVLGFLASRWTVPIVDRGLTRPLVLFVSAAAAVVLIGRLLFG